MTGVQTCALPISIIFFSGVVMTILGLTGILTVIVNFAGDNIINGMMAGVGIMLTKISLTGLKESKVVTASSIVSAFVTYFFFGHNLVYTIVVCVVFSSLVANVFKIDFGGGMFCFSATRHTCVCSRLVPPGSLDRKSVV